MKSTQMPRTLTFFLTLFLCQSISISLDARLDLKFVDAGSGYTKFELVRRAAQRSKNRIGRLNTGSISYSNQITQLNLPVEPHQGEYSIELAIGTPPQSVLLMLDTGSDLIWTQCQPCLFSFNQTLPLYDPSMSSSYNKVPCSSNLCNAMPSSACHQECLYAYGYADNSSTLGILSSETFTFVSSSDVAEAHNIGFGCGVLNQGVFLNESGIAGFGRGDLSLISQLGVGKFSYCLTSFDQNKTSPLFMGSLAELTGLVQTTPLLKNPKLPSFYYLSLKGITVGTKRVRLPKNTFALKKNGRGGVIIDSGTAITRLASVAFRRVKEAFISQMKLGRGRDTSGTFDLCFVVPASSSRKMDWPRLVFNFDGADMNVPRENYVSDAGNGTGLSCLLIIESGEETIIGNIQQQNMKILYDLEGKKLSFAPAQCDQL